MTLNNTEIEIQHIKNKLEQKLNHPFLRQFVQQPVIDEDKIVSLYFLFKKHPIHEKENYIITVMLIQIALNIHDSVADGPEMADHLPERKEKQLAVLAGDYYSGLYYLTLSELDDFEMTNILATSIKYINELKMKLYYHEYTSLNGWLDMIKEINSLLLVHVADYVGANELQLVLQKWLLMNQIASYQNDNLPLLVEKWVSSEFSVHETSLFLREKTIELRADIITLVGAISDEFSDFKSYILDNIHNMKPEPMIIFNTKEG